MSLFYALPERTKIAENLVGTQTSTITANLYSAEYPCIIAIWESTNSGNRWEIHN